MKRAGKLFLVVVLVLSMFWTSTGTSNVMGVFAENLSGAQNVDRDKESTEDNTEEKDEETQEEKKASKTETADSEEVQKTTSKQKETKSATAKSEKRTVKSTEATTAMKKDTDESVSVQAESNESDNLKTQDAESGSPTVTEVSLDDYINTSASGIWITINGQKETLEDIQKNNIKVPKGSPVEIKLEYGAISNLTENTKLVYQIPNAITITEEKNNGEVTDGKIIAGTYSITKDGKVTITLNKEYLQDREGKIDGGTFIVEGNFKKDWGGTPGGDKIVFGKAEVTIPFEENQVVTKAELSLNKKVKKYNKDDNTITYQVTVKAPSDNTQDVPDVTVQDTFTTNGDKLILTDGKKYEIVTVPDGTEFDTSSGQWTVGTMRPGTSYTLEYKVKINPTFFNELSDVKKGIKNKAIAYSGTTEMKSDTATQTFQNNLNIEKSKGSGVIIDSETGKTYIDYTVTVTAPADNTNDMTNVVVDDVFSDAKEEVKSYSNIKATLNDGTTTTELKNSVNTTVNDATNTKSLKWTIGTMKPGSTATLTYRVELKDDVWERGNGWEINKKLKNTATVTADNMDKKDAVATVNLRKVWIWKSGSWNANKAWSNGQGTGLMQFTIHANESTGGGPVLDKNFTFTDELYGNYVYDGKVVVKIYQKGPADKGNLIATKEIGVDGKKSWTYTPTGEMSGPYYYEFEYYARPNTNGHGGAVSNKAGIIGNDGSNFNHQTTWQGTGSNEYSLKKEYVGGVGVGAARWKTTIPSNVYAGTHYEDYLYYKYDSNTKVDSYHTFTQEQLDAIVVKLGTRTFIKGTDYNVTPILATINKVDKIIGFNLKFLTDTETVTKDNPITIEYASTPNLSGIATGKNRTFKNTGRIYYGNLYLTAKAETTYAQYADFSKAAGDYDAANKQLAWYLTLNENSKMSGNATITENIPDGLKFVSAEISERGSEAAGTAIQVDESTKDSNNVKINVSGLVSNDHRNRNGYIKIKVITEVTDENFLQENKTKKFTNSAELAYGTDEKRTASAIANITNKALSKDAIHNSSTYPYVKYTIKVNPNGYNLLESKNTIDVVDSMTEHMILMEDSVEVSSNGKKLSAEEWSLRNDADNHRFILTVPDDKPLTITYQVSVNKPTGEKIKLSNAVYYSGHEQAGKTDERTVTVMDSAATVTGSLLLYVKKKDSLTKSVLSGADFALAEVVRNADGSIVYENGEPKLSNTMNATTDKDGEATFKINQNTGSDKLYCLYEKKAPANYKKLEKKVYVAFKTQNNTDNLNIQYVQNGGSVEMENTPVGSLSVEKKVVGNQIPADDTKSGYEMQVTAAESNADKDLTKATVTVTKAATGTTGSETITPDAETKDNKQFKFKVTLTRNDAVYTRKFTIKYSDKEQSEEVRATNGVYEFTLKDTQSAVFSDLPSGTKYTVEEVADSDYDASVKVNNTVQNADSNNNADNNKNVAATAEGTIDKTGDTVEFTNTRKLGAFSFTKTVKGNMQDKEQSYDFYVEVDGKPFNGNAAITQKATEKSDDADTQDKSKEDKSENTAGTTVQITDGKLSLTDGQTATIANIPAGVSYSIKETTGDRYVTLINDKITAETTGTVEEGKTTETQFVNQVIHLNITKTDLTGEREVAGAAMTLYKAEDVNEDGTVKDGAEALDSWVSGKESFHDFGPAIKAGESYVLVETAAPDGYTYAENISFTVNADGTIKTDAEKTTDKETGEDVYLVKDDVTKVSIKKMDITGNNEVAGARLLLKDKEGNVIESWMSATEAHVFEQKLIAGETYTLAEVTAPSGYEVAADITFTVNKDGTVSIDGKAVDGNEIIMKDDTTPVGEEGKLVVSKLVTFQGKNQAVNRTFYVALFSDADCTQKVSNVKELKCEGAWSAYTVFEHLKDGTYYVAETDEDGNKLESSEACKIEGNGTKCQITPTQKTAYAVIENQLLIPGDDFLNTLHNLTVTKNVTLDGEQISEKYSGTFYVSLFTDPYYTNRTGDVKELQIQNGKSTSVSFTDLADGTYYVAETDKDGNPVENTDFGFDVSYDGDITVSFTEQNTDSTLAITNDMTERNPEYKKYSKKEDDGDDGKEKKKTSTSKNNSSNKTTKKGKNSKTGDNSHILFYAALAAAALAAGSAEVYRRRRRATGRNKHDR